MVPSIYEPFGLVALEAMASGCPCIVADTGGLREVVPEGERVGLRFNGGDAEHLGVMIERLLVDGELRDRLVAEASEHVLSFDWEDIARRTRAIYGELAPRRGPRVQLRGEYPGGHVRTEHACAGAEPAHETAKARGEARMTQPLMGLMQDDFPLNLHHIRRRMRDVHPDAEVVTLTAPGTVKRATFGEVSERVDRLARVLGRLGIEPGDRVGTFAWNNQRHFELYMAVPCVGAVLHTLNIRLFEEQLTYIVNHAEDKVIFVDDSLVPLLEKLAPRLRNVRHYVLMGDPIHPADPTQAKDSPQTTLPNALHYEELLEEADRGPVESFDYPEIDEHQAAALCYTSGTTGNPKGVLYSHRSISLHSTATLDEGRPWSVECRQSAGGRADVPRQRLGSAARRGAGGRRSDPARPVPAGGAAGAADRGRAPDADGLRADDLRRHAALRRRAPRGRPLLA